MELPRCDPLQKGCVFDLPQRHQKYSLPASSITFAGALAAITGVSSFFIIVSVLYF